MAVITILPLFPSPGSAGPTPSGIRSTLVAAKVETRTSNPLLRRLREPGRLDSPPPSPNLLHNSLDLQEVFDCSSISIPQSGKGG